MHEFSLVQGILSSVNETAQKAGALRVTCIHLSIGQMTEVVDEALRFAFEVLSEGTLSEGAQLDVHMIEPRSRCLDCGHEFVHDRFHVTCPQCESYVTQLLAGKELFIESIDADLPDEEDKG